MSHVELLTEFQGRVDEYERYQQFVQKAQSQLGNFNAVVVEKVIRDNSEKSATVASAVVPLLTRMGEVVASLRGDLDGIRAARQITHFSLEELELRLAIGELSEEAFNTEASAIKSDISDSDQRIGELEGQLGKFDALLARWSAVSGAAVSPRVAAESVAMAVDVSPPATSGGVNPGVADPDEVEEEDFADQELDASVAGATTMFPAQGVVTAFKQPADVAAIFDDAPSDSSSILGDDLDLHDDDSEEAGSAGASDVGRKASLIYLEGTADEKAYFFNGETITIGRGRDNDVQVKNDSKVSRNHCRLVHRGPHYFIEDLKSANGSLVEGELITERRLFGGEEVIIGETFFRFRILR